MEVKIGVQHASREIVVDSDLSHDKIIESVRSALTDDDGVFVLADAKGRTVMIPVKKLAYVEVGEETARKVGFGSL
uniref:ATP-binding protein n=1 Tax=uncultured Nocardioidaceae bacterium TaxID=253824 RepID=A0A6J4LDF1_9ACTN|nr:MAG: hypothetical protein AVDCRST_MAG46-1295 [uncultured Nocardioidaceae bacterium]